MFINWYVVIHYKKDSYILLDLAVLHWIIKIDFIETSYISQYICNDKTAKCWLSVAKICQKIPYIYSILEKKHHLFITPKLRESQKIVTLSLFQIIKHNTTLKMQTYHCSNLPWLFLPLHENSWPIRPSDACVSRDKGIIDSDNGFAPNRL